MSTSFMSTLRRITHPWETLKSTPQVKALEEANARLDQHLEKAKSDLEVNLQAFREALQARKKPAKEAE